MPVSYKKFWLTTIILMAAATTFAFVSTKAGTTSVLWARRSVPTVGRQGIQNSANAATFDSGAYVQMPRLWPELRHALKALGNRLEKPGKERIILSGTLLRAGDAHPRPIRISSEFTGRLRLEDQSTSPTRVLIFKGHGAGVMNGSLDDLDQAAIETLVYDSAEHFFIGQMKGMGTRSLGSRFRLDDGEAADYSGPYYDIYQTTEQIKIGQDVREQTKLYCFNSDTHLLERVQYTLLRNGSETTVEINLSDWSDIEGQKVPGHILRLENNAPMLTLTLTPSSLEPQLADSAFDIP
jgi:hypothetical protein